MNSSPKSSRPHFVPLEKQSKKQQRAYYSALRKEWGPLNPVTRRPEKPQAYNRAKSRRDPFTGGHFSVRMQPVPFLGFRVESGMFFRRSA